MGLRQYVKNTVKDNTNVKTWSSWETVKDNARTVYGFVQDLKPVDQTGLPVPTTFEAAIRQYGLSEADIRSRMRTHFFVAVFCLVLGFVAIGWMIFLLTKLMFLSALVAFSLGALMLAYAFREHFFYFQMKQRRLNCSVSEWFSSFFAKKTKKNIMK